MSYYNEVVFANMTVVESGSTDFSVRVVKRWDFVLIGAAIETPGLIGGLYKLGWVLIPQLRGPQLWALGKLYHTENKAIREGQVVTVRVDVARKQIVYLVDGVPAGPPHTMIISDAEIQKLRPAVQTSSEGDILEIV